uniref:Uncharacterized protein n=1 Tax=Hyaloperonospora arabidopsidis (strain Emoy2) TaxID=559515 RepID=M4C5A9_HYAAE
MSTNEQCITSATQCYLLSQYCENILFVLTEYSYLIFTLCKLSCNGGTPLHINLTKPNVFCVLSLPFKVSMSILL